MVFATCRGTDSSASFTLPLDSLLAAGLVDTTSQHFVADSTRAAAEIHRRWAVFLAVGQNNPGRACQPSGYWLSAEREQWRCFALPLLYVPLHATAQVLRIERETTAPDVYRILTLFRSDSTRSPLRSAITVMTVFAVRSDTTWVFANAMPRFTSSWRREVVGPITYVIAPGYAFDPGRAAGAVRFADSLASLFAVPRLESLTYFLLPTVDDVYRIMGLQTPIKWGPRGGVTQPMNHMLFSGDPSVGEDYRHELAHILLSPISRSPLTFITEGVPTWLGGTSGMDFPTAAESLAAFVRSRLNVTLDSMIDHRYPVAPKYAAGAVFAAMVFERGGVDAVKALYGTNASSEDMRRNMERLFQQSWPAIATAWRARVLTSAPTGTSASRPPNSIKPD